MQWKLKPNGITAILFDLDGTLRHNLPSSNHTFFDIAVQLGTVDTPEKRRRTMRWMHYYWAQSTELMRDLEIYGRLTEAFWVFYSYRTLISFECPEAQAQTLAPQVHRRMTDEYQPQDHVPPDVRQTLLTLKESGFPLGVVSNRSTPFGDQMTALGLDLFFQFTLAAGEIKSWKPESGIFLHAVELLGAQPSQTVYVGDNYYADILGAANAGLRPVLLDPEGIFPDAECPVITTISGLLDILEK
jgi:HAD superfamily hydrolase (TIGR01509 family)